MDVETHLAALQGAFEDAARAIAQAADEARSAIENDAGALREMLHDDERAPIIAGVPVDEPPPYIPPPMPAAANALIPDTPLVEAPPSASSAASSLAFDDAPLWQS